MIKTIFQLMHEEVADFLVKSTGTIRETTCSFSWFFLELIVGFETRIFMKVEKILVQSYVGIPRSMQQIFLATKTSIS